MLSVPILRAGAVLFAPHLVYQSNVYQQPLLAE
jgi:hypothetical protein